MIWKSVWRVTSTELLTQVLLAIAIAVLGSLGVRSSSPVAWGLVAALLFLVIYRMRYKRL
jgi:uncharacterized membrane protein